MAHYDEQRERDYLENKELQPLQSSFKPGEVRQVKEQEQVNNFLLQLLNFRNEIELDGWIIIPPSSNKYRLELRVEWFVDREKYSWAWHYEAVQISFCDAELIPLFITRANNYIRGKTKLDGVD